MRTITAPTHGIRRLAAAVLALSLLLASLTTGPQQRVSVVATTSGSLSAVVEEVRELGGQVTSVVSEFGILTAELPEDAVGTLSSIVDHVTLDRMLAPAGRPGTDGDPPSTTAAASAGATSLHAQGVTGEGVGIAIVDTGVDRVGPIRDRLIAEATMIGTAPGDRHGHGTFMAGLLTGDGAGVPGVAPDSHLVSIRVADDDGSTSLSSMIRGLATVHATAEELGVRVVLLAFGVEPGTEADLPLSVALRALWADGLTVVVPAGNGGPTGGTLTAPGVDPYLLVVGASDDQGTADTSDDDLLAESGRGPVGDRTGPDLLAPGTSLQSMRSPGSAIDRTHRDARVGSQGFRATGTSMAAAVAAGSAALLLQEDPGLTPDDVKGRLVDGAAPIATDATAAGAGLLDVAAAATSTATANTHLPALPQVDAPEPTGDGTTSAGAPEGFSWAGFSWAGDEWEGFSWAGEEWAGFSWAGFSWAGDEWQGFSWAGDEWAGFSWAGFSWAGDEWAGFSWAGFSWAGFSWAGDSWAADWSGSP